MRWLISWLSILLSLLLVTHCQKSSRVTERSAEVALYSDQGTDDNCVQATKNMFEWMGYTVSLVEADYINNKGVEGFSILCIPGGDMYQYAQDISSAGKEKIRDFIGDGGGYIGICG